MQIYTKPSESQPKKRKVSKKLKKSWRKHVDITDVEKYLENSRLEERLGAPFSERLNSELFVVDKIKDDDIVISSKKQRRIQLSKKEPKCFASLKSDSAVPDPISKRNRVRTVEERKSLIPRQFAAEKKAKGILTLKEKGAILNREVANKKRLNQPKRGQFDCDIWEETVISPLEKESQWMSTDAVRHIMTHLGKSKKRLPTSLHKKTSIVSAVEPPHPGTSYNPSYDDHQDLLRKVAEEEHKLMKEEAHLNRVTSKMFKKVSPEEKETNRMKELSEGLPITETESEQLNTEKDEDPNVKSINPPVKNMKKTLKQRRKQKEERILALGRVVKKTEKKKVADIYKLKLIKKQLQIKEEKEQLLREKRLRVKDYKSKEPKTLSRIKFEPLETQFALPSDITGNLRNSVPVGHLLKDRFKSLQQRNILAPGTLVLKRTKPNVKKFKKSDHKIDWEAEMKKRQ